MVSNLEHGEMTTCLFSLTFGGELAGPPRFLGIHLEGALGPQTPTHTLFRPAAYLVIGYWILFKNVGGGGGALRHIHLGRGLVPTTST